MSSVEGLKPRELTLKDVMGMTRWQRRKIAKANGLKNIPSDHQGFRYEQGKERAWMKEKPELLR